MTSAPAPGTHHPPVATTPPKPANPEPHPEPKDPEKGHVVNTPEEGRSEHPAE